MSANETVLPRELTPADQGFHDEKIGGLKRFTYVSPSQIKVMLTSMHAYHRQYILDFKPKDTPAKELGRLIHKALLEPEDFRKRYVVEKKFTGTGSRAAKTEWENDQPHDALILKQDQADRVLFILDSVSNHSEACDILKGSAKEVHTYVKDEEWNQWFYGIIDILRTSMGSDLKSCASAHPDAFGADIIKYKYYVQASLYSRMIQIITGKKMKHFPIIAVENTEPYTTMVYKMPDALMEIGDNLNQVMVRKYQAQMKKFFEDPKSVIWPGYGDHTGMVEPPISSWKLSQLEAIQEAHSG